MRSYNNLLIDSRIKLLREICPQAFGIIAQLPWLWKTLYVRKVSAVCVIDCTRQVIKTINKKKLPSDFK